MAKWPISKYRQLYTRHILSIYRYFRVYLILHVKTIVFVTDFIIAIVAQLRRDINELVISVWDAGLMELVKL